MRRFAFALAAFAMISTPVMAAAPCKDAKGKFIKCPPKATPTPAATKAPATVKKTEKKAAAKTTTRCRNAKGQFAKCGTPGAKPA